MQCVMSYWKITKSYLHICICEDGVSSHSAPVSCCPPLYCIVVVVITIVSLLADVAADGSATSSSSCNVGYYCPLSSLSITAVQCPAGPSSLCYFKLPFHSKSLWRPERTL